MHTYRTRTRRTSWPATLVALSSALAMCAAACGPKSTPAKSQAKPPKDLSPAKNQWFQNQGGMWMPEQLAAHGETLRKLGLDMSLESLANPLDAPLGAIVSLGFCSASFVSPKGLMVTNHHCVQGALQYHSTPENNYVVNGFLAKTMEEEKWNGPSSKIWVTRSIEDVSAKVLAGLDAIDDPKARYDTIEAREKSLVAECEKDRPDTRCRVASYFRGAEYKLIESMEIRDIRTVYVPHQGIGVFGGDEDNWMWPRHTGDYSFFRAYVGPDGMPADHSPDNIPYEPKHHLKIASEPLGEGDLVFVAGYPGRTYRHLTAAAVKDAIEWSYPRRIAQRKEKLALIKSITDKDPDAKIKSTSMVAGLANGLKNSQGMLEGPDQGGPLRQKARPRKGAAELDRCLAGEQGAIRHHSRRPE